MKALIKSTFVALLISAINLALASSTPHSEPFQWYLLNHSTSNPYYGINLPPSIDETGKNITIAIIQDPLIDSGSPEDFWFPPKDNPFIQASSIAYQYQNGQVSEIPQQSTPECLNYPACLWYQDSLLTYARIIKGDKGYDYKGIAPNANIFPMSIFYNHTTNLYRLKLNALNWIADNYNNPQYFGNSPIKVIVFNVNANITGCDSTFKSLITKLHNLGIVLIFHPRQGR